MLGPASCPGTFVHGVLMRLAQERRSARGRWQPQIPSYPGKIRVVLTRPIHVYPAFRAIPFVVGHFRAALRAPHGYPPCPRAGAGSGLTMALLP